MEDPNEDIAFLARSQNRVRVLFALVEAPGSRRDLGERTHVSRVTLGRVVSDFVDRGWVTQSDGEFCITPLGRLVADAFGQLQETVAAARDLRSVSDWYPEDGFGFDFGLLSEASFTTPNQQDPLAPVRTAADHIAAADKLQLLTHATAPENTAVLRDRVVEGRLELELVGTTPMLAATAEDPAMAAQMGEIFDAGVPVYKTEATVPYIVAIHDDVVDIGLDDDRGLPAILIESEHPEVLAWARETIRTYREGAERIDEDQFLALATADGATGAE